MNAEGSQLAQVRPSGVTAVVGYSNPIAAAGGRRGLNAEITLIAVCNTTAAPAAFSLFHDDDGTVFSQATALYYGKSLAANDTALIAIPSPNSGFAMKPGASFGVQSSVASALTFTFYGVTQQVPMQ
jgi:hypothetical protein